MGASDELYTAGKIAAELKVPPAKVKKAITELKLKPVLKKGVCAYYSQEALAKVRKAVA